MVTALLLFFSYSFSFLSIVMFLLFCFCFYASTKCYCLAEISVWGWFSEMGFEEPRDSKLRELGVISKHKRSKR